MQSVLCYMLLSPVPAHCFLRLAISAVVTERLNLGIQTSLYVPMLQIFQFSLFLNHLKPVFFHATILWPFRTVVQPI